MIFTVPLFKSTILASRFILMDQTVHDEHCFLLLPDFYFGVLRSSAVVVRGFRFVDGRC